MYNILITDDEQIVIDSLSFIINKNFEGQVKIFTALSGTDALQIVTKENIDIIFMDINMPGLSGLETVSCITKLKPDTIIIILSAFDRFQYAQEAMNLGAFKYITKPVNRNIVIQTIRSAMDLVDTKRGKLNADIELHKKLDLVSPMIESDFIFACIFNNENTFNLSAYLDYFNISDYPWCFCCFEIPGINSENQHKTYLKIRDLLNDNYHCLVSTFIMNRIIILYSITDKNYIPELCQNDISKLFSTLSYKIGAGIRAGISRVQTDWRLLKSAYNESLSALNQTPINGGIIFSGNKTTQEQFSIDNTQEFKKQIISRIKQGDTSSLNSFFELFSSQLVATQTDSNKIKNTYFDLLVSANNITKEINENFHSETFDNAFSTLSNENDLSMIKSFVQKFLHECTTAIINVRTQSDNPLIKKVCDYINDNISKDISLEQMADYVNVSSFYLSKLFKEEKGITFVNFLTDKRLEQSKELLKNTNLSIKEITSAIGYNDQNYFSRLFKNKYGVSPTEYRSE